MLNLSTKWCPRCRKFKSADSFHKHRARVDGLDAYCKICKSLQSSERRSKHLHHYQKIRRDAQNRWRLANPELARLKQKRTRLILRLEALIAYGGNNPKCACLGCNENRWQFLTIDHVNGGGTAHRREISKSGKEARGIGGSDFFRWLRHNNYPTGFRVLCFNCNIARGTGPCPVHENDTLIADLSKLNSKRCKVKPPPGDVLGDDPPGDLLG